MSFLTLILTFSILLFSFFSLARRCAMRQDALLQKGFCRVALCYLRGACLQYGGSLSYKPFMSGFSHELPTPVKKTGRIFSAVPIILIPEAHRPSVGALFTAVVMKVAA